MTTALVFLALSVFALLVGLGSLTLVVRSMLQRQHAELELLRAQRAADGYCALIGFRVIASVREGGSIRGVLTKVYENALVLEHPEFIGAARPAALGAEVTIARSAVPLLQRVDED